MVRTLTGLRRLWTGDLPLNDAFWNWAVIGGIAVNLTTSLAFVILMAMDEPVAAWIAGYAPSVPYNFAVLVGVWRSAARVPDGSLRPTLYRVITLIGMIALTLT